MTSLTIENYIPCSSLEQKTVLSSQRLDETRQTLDKQAEILINQSHFYQAGKIADSMSNARSKNHIYTKICSISAKKGYVICAEKFANLVNGQSDRDRAYQNVCSAYIKQKDVYNAERVANLIVDQWEKDLAYERICIGFANQKDVVERAVSLISDRDLQDIIRRNCEMC